MIFEVFLYESPVQARERNGARLASRSLYCPGMKRLSCPVSVHLVQCNTVIPFFETQSIKDSQYTFDKGRKPSHFRKFSAFVVPFTSFTSSVFLCLTPKFAQFVIISHKITKFRKLSSLKQICCAYYSVSLDFYHSWLMALKGDPSSIFCDLESFQC